MLVIFEEENCTPLTENNEKYTFRLFHKTFSTSRSDSHISAHLRGSRSQSDEANCADNFLSIDVMSVSTIYGAT